MTTMAAIHPETEIVPFLRGELSADERARVGAHLEGCSQCRATADASSAMLSKLAGVIDDVRDPDWKTYRAELRRKLRDTQQSRGRVSARWPVFGWPSMAMGAAAGAVLAISIVMHRGT